MLREAVKKKIDLIILVLLSAIILGYLSLIIFKWAGITEESGQSKDEIEILTLASHELNSIWQNGDIDSLWKNGKLDCLDLLGSPSDTNDPYLRCNPDFLQCYFEHMNKGQSAHLSINYKGKKHRVFLKQFQNQKYYQLLTKSLYVGENVPRYGVLIELFSDKKNKHRLRFALKDTCSEILLPQRIYAVGPMPDQLRDDWKWDNFSRQIFIDKYLVSNRDIREWIMYDKASPLGHFKMDNQFLSFPATTLNLSEMKKYCEFRGKELLSTHVFDAATFLPRDTSDSRPNLIIRSPWPFSRVSKEGFLFVAQKNENYEVTKADCTYAYTADCLKLMPYQNYNNWSLSFIGLAGSLGGYMEVFNSILSPEKNLKESSFYFLASSATHRLGKRSFWDGLGFDKNNFNFSDEVDMNNLKQDKLEVAFRCMRQNGND